MQIEFGLPTGAGGMAAAAEAGNLRRKLAEWSKRYNVAIHIGTDRHSYRHWLTVDFVRERDFTLFALSWQERSFMGYQKVINTT